MRLPAETEPQSGILLTWPHARSDWRAWLDAADAIYLDMTRAISPRETGLVICHDEQHREHVARMLGQAGIDDHMLRFAIAPTNDTWVRDYGPFGLADGNGPCLLDFTFNGWGNKYAASLDNAASIALDSSS